MLLGCGAKDAENCISNKPLHVCANYRIRSGLAEVRDLLWKQAATVRGRFGALVLGVKRRMFSDRCRIAEEREPMKANSMETVVFD